MKTGRKKFGTTDAERSIIDIVRLSSRKVRGGRVPTLQSIADKLNDAGHTAKGGGRFLPQTIQSIQRRIAGGEFREKGKRIKKTQLTSGDFRGEDQITSDLIALRAAGDIELRSIYLVLLGTGLRASELCDLQCGDVGVGKRMVNVRRGKGAKQRAIIVSNDTMGLLEHLIGGRSKHQPVFTNSQGGKLTYKALYRRGRKIAEIIGDPMFHLHSMRHTFATRLYNYAKDLKFVAEQLGHSSIETTGIYAKTLNAEKLRQMNAMDSLGRSPAEPASPGDSTSKRTESP